MKISRKQLRSLIRESLKELEKDDQDKKDDDKKKKPKLKPTIGTAGSGL